MVIRSRLPFYISLNFRRASKGAALHLPFMSLEAIYPPLDTSHFVPTLAGNFGPVIDKIPFSLHDLKPFPHPAPNFPERQDSRPFSYFCSLAGYSRASLYCSSSVKRVFHGKETESHSMGTRE